MNKSQTNCETLIDENGIELIVGYEYDKEDERYEEPAEAYCVMDRRAKCWKACRGSRIPCKAMSLLSEKYNIPPETVQKMIKDGVISCSWPTYDHIYELWKSGKSTSEISEIVHVSQRNVQYILKKTK